MVKEGYDYDVVIVGGSIAGLLAAREAANNGVSVLVLEEDPEIGTPEHCGGLVSINALKEILNQVPEHIILNRIRYAIISVLNTSVRIDASKQMVIAIDRRGLDKHIAIQASREGADIMLMSHVTSFMEEDNYVKVNTNRGSFLCKVMIDARGCGVLASKGKGFLPSAQYEVNTDGIEDSTVEVHIDQCLYPGFFAWIIPDGKGICRIGVAGRGINVNERLEGFIRTRIKDHGYKYIALRKIFAPIWVDGPQRPFVQGRRIVRVGDAAGQSKPTTAGGIYTSGMGGIIAGRLVSNAILNDDYNAIKLYEDEWLRLFGDEFWRMLMLRRLFERLDNKAIEKILKIMNNYIDDISLHGDFDFHSLELIKIIKGSDLFALAKTILGNEIRRLL